MCAEMNGARPGCSASSWAHPFERGLCNERRGTEEITYRARVSKPYVWRWQERFMREGVAGLLRDKTRRPGLPPLPPTRHTIANRRLQHQSAGRLNELDPENETVG
jgi:hypothetical protein